MPNIFKKKYSDKMNSEIYLMPYTREYAHEFFKKLKYDPLLFSDDVDPNSFKYDKDAVDKYYDQKSNETNRLLFAIMLGSEVIGELQLKNIDRAKNSAQLSIMLIDESFKNKGYGSEAIKQAIKYGKEKLNLKTIYASTTHKNLRSKRVLEKLGFILTNQDELLKYYKLEI